MRKCLVLLGVLGGCATSDDPAAGGFFSGVAGIASGSYDQRIADREATVAAEKARNAELEAEYAELNETLIALKAKLARSVAASRSNEVPMNAATETRVRQVLTSEPATLAELREAVAKARALTDEIARLSL